MNEIRLGGMSLELDCAKSSLHVQPISDGQARLSFEIHFDQSKVDQELAERVLDSRLDESTLVYFIRDLPYSFKVEPWESFTLNSSDLKNLDHGSGLACVENLDNAQIQVKNENELLIFGQVTINGHESDLAIMLEMGE